MEGRAAPGFEAVAEEFERTLDGGGASFAAVVDGEPVVDLWGGDAHCDTLYLVFSGTKGLVAVCLLLLIERGCSSSTRRLHATDRSSPPAACSSGTSPRTRPGCPASAAAWRRPISSTGAAWPPSLPPSRRSGSRGRRSPTTRSRSAGCATS